MASGPFAWTRAESYRTPGAFVSMLFGLFSLVALGALVSAIIFGDALLTGKAYQGANGIINNGEAVLISAAVFGFSILLAGPLGNAAAGLVTGEYFRRRVPVYV